MAITKHKFLDDMRPGEVVLANRIRMCHPASVRPTSLPETDAELCHLICKAAHVAFMNIAVAHEWCRKHILEEMNNWSDTEQRMALQRLSNLWEQN